MPRDSEPYETADIRVGEVIWSKTTSVNDMATQQKHLSELSDMGDTGVILDCALVEIANSELLNLLVRVRTLTTKANKGFALFNVTENLSKSIKACRLGSILPVAGDFVEAKKMVYDAAHGKGGLAGKFKRMIKK
jgi:anti-anti-sigma regulatory factor